MAVTNTTRLNLLKPDLDELANPVTQIAENMQKIDDGVALTGHAHTGGNDGPQIQASGLADSAVTDPKIGNRTADQALLPTGATGTLGQFVSWFAAQFKRAQGGANWWDAPAVTLATIAASWSRRDQAETRTGDLTMGAGTKLILAADPVGALEAVTKGYADALKAGLLVKDPVRVATTANIALNGIQTIDGVLLVAGDRVLVKNQATGSQNGIYVTAAGAWSLASDADTNAEVKAGLYTMVTEGGTFADTGFVLTTNDPLTLGTTALTFTQYASVAQLVAGAGLSKSGNQVAVDFPVSGGSNGVSSQPARSDHTHTPAGIGAETPAGAQGKADTATEESLVVESVVAVTGAEATNVQTSMGPAVEFANASTQSVTWNRVFPFGANACKVELRYAADVANAGNFRVRVAYRVNGGAVTNVDVTVTPGNDILLHTVDLGIIVPDGSVNASDLINFTLSRLGADAADTHTGKLRIYQTRLKRG